MVTYKLEHFLFYSNSQHLYVCKKNQVFLKKILKTFGPDITRQLNSCFFKLARARPEHSPRARAMFGLCSGFLRISLKNLARRFSGHAVGRIRVHMKKTQTGLNAGK